MNRMLYQLSYAAVILEMICKGLPRKAFKRRSRIRDSTQTPGVAQGRFSESPFYELVIIEVEFDDSKVIHFLFTGGNIHVGPYVHTALGRARLKDIIRFAKESTDA